MGMMPELLAQPVNKIETSKTIRFIMGLLMSVGVWILRFS